MQLFTKSKCAVHPTFIFYI